MSSVTVQVRNEDSQLSEKRDFQYIRGGIPENMMLGHYIVEMGSNNIVFEFPNNLQRHFDCVTKIFTFYYFVCKI